MSRPRSNRPEIRLSSLPLHAVFFAAGNGSTELCQVGPGRFEYVEHRTGGATRRPMVLCPEPACGRWVQVERSALKSHCSRADVYCPASSQPIKIDLTPDQHRVRLHQAHHVVEARRAACLQIVPGPPVPRFGQAAA